MEKNKNYMLRSDITLTGTHTPYGTSADPFKGRFDGMFHEITGLTLGAGTATEYVGLFGTTDGATIMNVGLKNANLSSVDYGGGLVGHAKGKTVISAVYNESTAGIGHAGYAGGLVGWLDSSSLDHAYNTAKVDMVVAWWGSLMAAAKCMPFTTRERSLLVCHLPHIWYTVVMLLLLVRTQLLSKRHIQIESS